MMIDADILIDLRRKHPPAWAWFTSLVSPPAVSGIAAIELLFNCRDTADMRSVQIFLQPLPVLWPTEAEMEQEISLYPPLSLSHNLGLLDAVIAATAIGHGQPLATYNAKHFRSVPGLTIVQPYAR